MTQNLPSKNIAPNAQEMQILQTIARSASTSGLYTGVGNEQKILMILLAARELGIKPMMALNGGLWNIQGRIEISARLMNSMIRRAGHSIVVKEINTHRCVLEGKRADTGDTFITQFTIEEAQRAGLTSRDVWRKYTEDMLYARAMSRLARRLFSDVIGTAYVEGEIGEPRGKVIDVSPIEHFGKEEMDDLEKQAIERLNEDPNIAERLEEFASQYADENPDEIAFFVDLCAQHWRRSKTYVLEKYRNSEKFITDFSTWKARQKRIV
jgi:hypothetical protein